MKRFLSILLVLVLIGSAAYAYWHYFRTPKPPASAGITTAPVHRADLEASINAIGSLAPERQQALAWAATGTVSEVLVAQDEPIIADQVLARLDPQDVELSLDQARAALAISEATLARASQPATAEDIATAKAALISAQANLADLQAGVGSRDKQLAQLAVDQAKNSLYGAQANRDAIKGSPISSPGQVASAEAQVLNAEIAVKIAELNYGKLWEPVRESQLRAAEAQITQAESTLARLKAQPSAADLAVSEAQVAQARVAVQVAERRRNDLVLTAPFSGTLAAWSLNVGDRAAPSIAVGTLVDESRYHIDLSIDETEIPSVAVGSEARITLDAYPTQLLHGRVTRLGLLGTTVTGIVNYAVRIDLQPTNLKLRPAMTASVEIISEKRENVLVVPNRSLSRDASGKFVEILQQGSVTKLYITTGIASNDYTEVLTGLEEGQEIIISRPRESVISTGMFGG